MSRYFACFLLFILGACNNQNDQKLSISTAGKQNALAKSANSAAFNQSFNTLLSAYFSLKDQLVAEKDSGIAQAGRSLMLASDSLKLSELKADSNLVNTAKTYADGISSELLGLLGETTLLAKRRSFQMISDQLYDLIRTVQYDREILYHFYCSVSFDDQGAYWVSDNKAIQNPYLPKKQPPCGEIRDSINFLNPQ